MQLPEEFLQAKLIQRFHRFAIFEHGEHAYFGLLGEDGINNYFQCSRAVITGLALEFGGMAGHMEALSKSLPPSPQLVPFYTTMVFAGALHGGDAGGQVMLNFFTPSGNGLTTILNAECAATLEFSLKNSLDALPHRPKPANIFNTYTPGAESKSSSTTEYFGQQYPSKTLEALGLLMVRANLLDRAMVQLFTKLSGLSTDKAEALFFSSRNNAARVGMIVALLPTVDIKKEQKEDIKKSLDKARSVMDQRNDLVHGEWRFNEDKMAVDLFTPTAPKPEKRHKTLTVTPQFIEALASEYRGATMMISAACHYQTPAGNKDT
ncbi:hypothetical protein ACFONG_15990 [Uliginosibacterium paludis]|uniref:Apea-like HEPN domain-containing protein n=1 Tax=Uliginosibacterium paludis TaxID=1615952 RepID=A0ABV2CUI1_9RHOO